MLSTTPPPLPRRATTTVNSSAEQREEDTVLFARYVETKIFDTAGKLVNSDKKLRNTLADRNCKLVTYVVNKFYNKKPEHKALREDLLQEGSMGLLSAIDGFDPTLGFKFSTYAVWWVKQAISNYLLSQDPFIHVPSHIRTAQNKVLKKMRELHLDFEDLTEENSEALGVTEKMMNSINASLKSKWVSSLDEELTHTPLQHSHSHDEKTTLKDLLTTSEDTVTADQTTDFDLMLEAVRKCLETVLSEREKLIILLRYNVIEENDLP